MQTFYRTTKHGTEIRAVQAIKVTEKTITLAATKHRRECRANRSGGWEIYHETFAEAKQHLIERSQRRIEASKTAIVREEQDLAAVQALTEPTHHDTDV